MAKKIRGPVIIDPVSAPKQESITTPETTAPPLAGEQRDPLRRGGGDQRRPAISGSGTR